MRALFCTSSWCREARSLKPFESDQEVGQEVETARRGPKPARAVHGHAAGLPAAARPRKDHEEGGDDEEESSSWHHELMAPQEDYQNGSGGDGCW
jgi:hypothetical protein